MLPLIRDTYPDLDLRVRETHTQALVNELLDGALDVLLVALPIDHPHVETLHLFDDPFVLAAPRNRKIRRGIKATSDLLKNDRLLLLEEGHCLRDQALAVCELRQVSNIDTFGTSSLSTIVQMVANGMGMTLLPEISIDVESAHGQVRLIRFEDPEPKRALGLAWRASSRARTTSPPSAN